MEPLFISIIATAQTLSIGRTSVYELIKDGKLDTIKMGRRRLVSVASIKRLVGEQE
jgi:excisionase family DNA binding protein